MTYERRYLGISAGLAPQIPADPSKVVGYRLPTEVEWESAARGGNKSEGFRYAGNDKISEVAWFDRNSEGMTQEVGLKLPNELGLFDMSGSWWEWCSDSFGDYDEVEQTNPYVSNGSIRVIRGGGWSYVARALRVTSRNGVSPTGTSFSIGFRVCKTAP